MNRKPLMVVLLLAVYLCMPLYAVAQPADQVPGTMRHYVMFFGLTDKAMQNVKDNPAMVEAAKETVRRFGGEVRAFYALLGSDYNTFFILDAPDDEAVAKMAMTIGAGGNFVPNTHPLFNEDEFNNLISALP